MEKNRLLKNLSSKYFNKYTFSSDTNINSPKKRFIKNDLKLQIYQIAQNNLNMLKRLIHCKKSVYNKQKLFKDYKQSQSYKKNSCKYPSIDFYKTIRISKYSSSLNNPWKSGNLFLNKNFSKQKINKTPYQKLFYKNEINESDNKVNRLILDNIEINAIAQKTVKEHFITHYSIKDFFEKKIIDENESNKQELINGEEKNKKNKKKIFNAKQKKLKYIFNKRNIDNKTLSNFDYKEKTKENQKFNNFCLTEKQN